MAWLSLQLQCWGLPELRERQMGSIIECIDKLLASSPADKLWVGGHEGRGQRLICTPGP